MDVTAMDDEGAPLDLFVVGGGINGAGIACDAVGRSLKVGLCEMNDFASATSSASTKLIHGGLRYLEQYEFRLVREALQEREVLLAKAPHLSRPLALRAAARAASAAPLDAAARPLPLRSSRLAHDPAQVDRGRPAAVEVRRRPEAVLQEGLRLFRRLGRRCAPGDLQRQVGAPDGRPHLRPPPLRLGATQRRRQTVEHRASGPRRRQRAPESARPGQRHRPLGEALPRRADPHQDHQARAPDQGQPHHRAAHA